MSTGGDLAIVAVAASLVATVVSGLFAIRLLRRWSARSGNRALGYWGASLAMFCLASAALTGGALVGWGGALFRVFYLFGAVLNVPWLALGSSEINATSPVVSRVTGAFVLLTGLLFVPGATGEESALFLPGAALGVAWGALLLSGSEVAIRRGSPLLVAVLTALAVQAVGGVDLAADVATDALPEGRDVFPANVRGLAVGGNAVGAVLVIVSAVAASVNVAWGRPAAGTLARARDESARSDHGRGFTDVLARWFFAGRRGQRLRHLVRGNLLIALGVLIAAAGGALSFLGDTTGHAVGLGLGVVVMYSGFVRTTRPIGGAGSVSAEEG